MWMRNWTRKYLKDISKIFSKIQIKSGASRTVMNQCWFLSLSNTNSLLSLHKAGSLHMLLQQKDIPLHTQRKTAMSGVLGQTLHPQTAPLQLCLITNNMNCIIALPKFIDSLSCPVKCPKNLSLWGHKQTSTHSNNKRKYDSLKIQ